MRIGRKKLVIPIILVFIFSAILNCNNFTYRLLYDHLDSIIYSQIEKYFIPDEKQKEFVKQKLAALLIWNRESALPHYKDLLVYMENSAEKGITKENIDHIYDTISKEAGMIAGKAAPDAADFVISLNKDQIENFTKEALNHKKEEQEKDSEIKDPVERKTGSTVKFLSRFYGSFSDEQTEKIKEYIKDKKYPVFDRWEYEEINRNRFIELVNRKADRKSFLKFIKDWISWEERQMPRKITEEIKAQRKINTELYLYIDKNIVTQQQRAVAVSNMKDLISVLDILISEK
jgi:hypothetical protein